MHEYIVKSEDLIGKLEGFPIEVVQAMVDEHFKQIKMYETESQLWSYTGGKKPITPFNITTFQEYPLASIPTGFTWSDTNKGHEFWEDIIVNKNFDLFFEKYPHAKRSKFGSGKH